MGPISAEQATKHSTECLMSLKSEVHGNVRERASLKASLSRERLVN